MPRGSGLDAKLSRSLRFWKVPGVRSDTDGILDLRTASSMDLISLDRAESAATLDMDLAWMGATLYLDTPRTLESDPSMFGLLFTDAAHHILRMANTSVIC